MITNNSVSDTAVTNTTPIVHNGYIVNRTVNNVKDPSVPENKEPIKISLEQQKVVLIGVIHSEYVYHVLSNELDFVFFNDYSCKIIYKALREYYSEYQKPPTLEVMYLEIDRNNLTGQFPTKAIKDLCKELYEAQQVEDRYAIDIAVEMIKHYRVSLALKKTFEAVKSGQGFNKIDLADQLVNAMKIEVSNSDVYQLSDVSQIPIIRKEALGDESSHSGKAITSILKGLNESLQYGGYQVGTLNLICAPPACFVGNTKIMTGDGAYCNIGELYRLQHINNSVKQIYGCSLKGDIEPCTYESIYLSKYVNELIEVTVDGKYVIQCTTDHPFMLRSGMYVKAEDLCNNELMPIFRFYSKNNEILTNLDHKQSVVKNGKAIPTDDYYEKDDLSIIVNHMVTSVKKIKLPFSVPVYGIVNAGKYHNYAIALNSNEGIFVSNTGKTSFLINEGANAAIQGFKVLHVFLGDMVKYDAMIRYSACLFAKSQNDIAKMTATSQVEMIQSQLDTNHHAINNVSALSYGSGEKTVSEVLEIIKNDERKKNIHYDMIIIDYADNFKKPGDNMYVESGIIYDKLALFGRTHNCVMMVASQPKISYWSQEIIPMEGAAESSKKQHIVDLMVTMNRHAKGATFGSLFIAKCRRGISGTIMRYNSNWEYCKLDEISEAEYEQLKASFNP